MPNSDLVTLAHLQRKAIIYIRQSTLHQQISNQESLRLQYALHQRAEHLGWHPDDIEIIDADLGLTGASAQHRSGFQELVTKVTQVLRGAHPLLRGDPPLTQLLRLVPAAGCVRLPGVSDCRQ
jgi:hypothetical protein